VGDGEALRGRVVVGATEGAESAEMARGRREESNRRGAEFAEDDAETTIGTTERTEITETTRRFKGDG